MYNFLLARAALLVSLTPPVIRAADDDAVVFQGMCDASAASAIDAERFIVADDEENILRVYERTGGPALGAFDVSKFLGNIGESAAEYFVLSDDGTTEIDGTACHDLQYPTLKRFRGRALKW